MIASRSALALLFAVSSSPASAGDFVGTPRCGDCWCIKSDPDGTCPTDTTGITDSFTETDKLYSTFELTNSPPFLTLRSESGGPCFPFSDTFGGEAIANYPESGDPQCFAPDDGTSTVCGYVYDPSSTTCEGRKYIIQNFDSTNDAMMANAAIVHEGACGVCSSAQDLGARINTYGTLETESIKCATSYTFNRDFPALVNCYKEMGFTSSCATLWGHFAATNGSQCALACFPDITGVTKLNGPAPQCEPSGCLTCQQDFRLVFDAIAGIEFPKAGITERIAQSCDNFYKVIHDPCIALDSGPAPDPPPQPMNPIEEEPVPENLPEFSGAETVEEESSGKGAGLSLFATTVSVALSLIGMII
mmetsp:Transcript_7875/g.16230  ORF Transcript_7875/g.16230 Transcript_7875/m.16230 type:complete len:361 (-) Transcript_7875:1366-2448(-)